MSSKHRIVLPIVLGSLLFFSIVFACIYFSMPGYVESSILPKISQQMGIPIHCDVRRIGLTGIDLGDIKLGDSATDPIFVESVRLDYSPVKLVKKHIDTIVIDGLKLPCAFIDGNFVIPGLDWQNLVSESKPEGGNPDKDAVKDSSEGRQLPVSFGSLKVRNAVLVCNYNGQDIRLPFDLSLSPRGENLDAFECNLTIYPREQELTISSYIDMRTNKVSLTIQSRFFQLDRFPDIARLLPTLIMSGSMDIDGTAEIQLNPFQIATSELTCALHNARIDYNGMTLMDSQASEDRKLPLRVKVHGEGAQWKIQASDVASVYPLPVRISDAGCTIQFSPETADCSGYFTTIVGRTGKNQQLCLQIVEPLETSGKFSGRFSKTGAWEFKLSTEPLSEGPNSGEKGCKMRYDPLDITSNISGVIISGKGEKTKGTVNYVIQFQDTDVRAYGEYVTIRMPSVFLIGNTDIDGNFTEGITGVTAFELKASDLEVNTESAAIRAPKFFLTGSGNYLRDGSFRIDTVSRFEDAEVLDLWYNTKTSGINGELPLQWPCEQLGKRGKVSAEAVYWDTLNLGPISGTVCQKGYGIIFDGEHKSALLSGLVLNSNGKFDLFSENGYEFNLDFRIPRFKSDSADLGQFFPSMKGILFGGEFEADGNVFFNTIHMKSSLKAGLKDSKIEYKEKGITIEGINHVLSIPDLAEMRSEPHQQFQFGKLSIGSLAFYEGKIDLQIESPQSFFIENCGFTWCSGHVYTHAMRIALDKTDYNIILLCDRLNLGEILDQFGIAKAEGSGTVNGRLPIRYENGNLTFDNGFLYSAPGEGGVIHVFGLDVLDIGIPQNTPQYSQIGFINAVLKDFNYNWVKISLVTKGEDLFLQMSFDGKPMNPLPFTYNKRFGSFSKVEATGKGGIYNPVHLDINFRLPINKIMYYGKSIGDIMGMM